MAWPKKGALPASPPINALAAQPKLGLPAKKAWGRPIKPKLGAA